MVRKHYYENKEELFMEIISDGIETIYEYAEKIVSDDPRLLPVMYIICLYHMIISDRKLLRNPPGNDCREVYFLTMALYRS